MLLHNSPEKVKLIRLMIPSTDKECEVTNNSYTTEQSLN